MEENAGAARALGKGMKAKRSKLEKREGIQRTLEGYRRFDFDYIPFGSNWEDPDEHFDYTGKDRRIGTCLLRFGMAVLAPLVLKVAYGCRWWQRKSESPRKKRRGVRFQPHRVS